MALLNLTSGTTIYGNTAVSALSTSPSTITTCPTSRIQKINSLYVANVSGGSAAQVTVYITRSATNYRLAANIVIGTGSTLDLVSKSLYLNEGDSLNAFANANSILESVCSYEEIS